MAQILARKLPNLNFRALSKVKVLSSSSSIATNVTGKQGNSANLLKKTDVPVNPVRKSGPVKKRLIDRAREMFGNAKEASTTPVITPKSLGVDLLTALNIEHAVEREKQHPRGALPTFFPGSVVKVLYSDSVTKKAHARVFVGICIAKRNRCLSTAFVLRNVVDGEPLEITFNAYDPLIEKIEVLRLARRKRAKLYYLRGRPNKESTFSFSMKAIPHNGGSIPVDRPMRSRKKR